MGWMIIHLSLFLLSIECPNFSCIINQSSRRSNLLSQRFLNNLKQVHRKNANLWIREANFEIKVAYDSQFCQFFDWVRKIFYWKFWIFLENGKPRKIRLKIIGLPFFSCSWSWARLSRAFANRFDLPVDAAIATVAFVAAALPEPTWGSCSCGTWNYF